MTNSPVNSAEYEAQRVLFTGGAGFIGSNTLIHMVKKYPKVLFVCLDNLSDGSNRANLEPIDDASNFVFHLGSITSESTVRQVMMQHQLDTVMHFAAQTHVDNSFVRPVGFVEANVVGTAVLLKVAREMKVRRFLHISTDEVYGESLPGVRFTEDAALCPGNPYSASKAAAENLVTGNMESFGKELPIVTVRPNNIFGPRQYPEKLIPKFVSRYLRGQTFTLHGEGASRRSFLYVEDAAEAFDTVLRRGEPGKAYNIGAHASSTRSVREVALTLLKKFGVAEADIPKHMELVGDRAKNDCAYDVNSSRIEALGWAPRTMFEEGLQRTLDWYLAHQNHWPNIDQALLPHNGGANSGSASDSSSEAGDKVWYAPYKFQAYGEEEIAEVNACLRDGWLAPGPRTEEFERRVAELFGKKYGIMVNSGSSGNMIGLASLGMQPGDEVVTPACTFSTVIAPLEQLQLKPVFVDVEAGRYVPSVDQVLAAITPRTKCILLPNLIGSKPDWAELRRRVPKGIWLFEDSCDTITHTTESDLSVISFYASHIITAGGLGGCVMYNSEALKQKALMFRDWGRIGNNSEDVSERFSHNVDGIEYDFKFLYGCKGYNMKACEMNAAFGLAQLRKLDKFKAIRRSNIARYVETLREAGTRYVLPAKYNEMDWLALPLMHPDRKGVLRYLESNNVQIRVCFAGNITRHPAYREYLQDFPDSDRIMAEGFLIGAHHGLTTADVDLVCKLLIEYDKNQTNASAASLQAPLITVSSESEAASLDF
jgi:CDP-6-deoxy-D-xylo-4-hexulose-3-dehydrase